MLRRAAGVAGEELAAALNKRLSLGPPGPRSPLDRQPSAEPPNPFSIASKLVAGLRQTPSGECCSPHSSSQRWLAHASPAW